MAADALELGLHTADEARTLAGRLSVERSLTLHCHRAQPVELRRRLFVIQHLDARRIEE